MLVASPELLRDVDGTITLERLTELPTLSMDEEGDKVTWELVGPDERDAKPVTPTATFVRKFRRVAEISA